MISLTKEARKDWIEIRTTKFKSDVFFTPMIRIFMNDAENCYVHGFFYATVLCVSAALNHLFIKITKPKLNKKGRSPPTTQLIKQTSKEIVPGEMQTDLIDFLEIVRHPMEHRKQIGISGLRFFEFLEKKDPQFFDQLEADGKEQELILPYIAFKALSYYYSICDSWYDYLVKRNMV